MLLSRKSRGFTIVELLIVILVIGILAAIVIVAYNGIQSRALTTRQNADMQQYSKAIALAESNTGKTLQQITGSYWSEGDCINPAINPSGTEPKSLPKTHACWTTYYDNLQKIGAAAGISLSSLRNGDSRGNPYTIDENEGEPSNGCAVRDSMSSYTGSGIATRGIYLLPSGNCT